MDVESSSFTFGAVFEDATFLDFDPEEVEDPDGGSIINYEETRKIKMHQRVSVL